jgi:hypothetical protein
MAKSLAQAAKLSQSGASQADASPAKSSASQ